MLGRVISIPFQAVGWLAQTLSAVVIFSTQIGLPLVLLGTLLALLGVDEDTLEFFELGKGTPIDDLDLLVAWLNNIVAFFVLQLVVFIFAEIARRLGSRQRHLKGVWLWQPLLASRVSPQVALPKPKPYAAELEDEYRPERSRLLAFTRVVTQVPNLIFVTIIESVCSVALLISVIALLATGRYPLLLYRIQAAGMRVDLRYKTYMGLLTDRYPPFTLGPHLEYPARVRVQPPAKSYNRLSILLRPIWGMHYFILYKVYMLYFELLSIVAWFAVVFGGHHPRSIFEEQTRSERYSIRASAYFKFMSDSVPHYDPIRL